MDLVYDAAADEMLNKAMDELQGQLDAAERKFESDGSYLEIKSKYANCNDMCVLGDIVAESNRITGELYASYEALIRAANSICKPLADQGVRPRSIKRVADFMKHINSECSTLGSNFSASVNGYSFGNVASTRYSPTAEARMIETNWNLLYSMHPQVAEEKRIEEERAAKLRAEREARAAAEKEKALAEYPQKLAEWEAECERVKKLHEKLIPEAKERAEKKYRRELVEKRDRAIEGAQKIIAEQQAIIDEAQATIKAAKFFEFGKKLEANSRIQTATQPLAAARARVAEAEAEYAKSLANIDAELQRKFKWAVDEVEKQHPMPRKPRDPNTPDPFSPGSGATAVQVANAGIKREIYETLAECGTLMTVVDIMQQCNAAADLSNQRVSALVRQLVSDGLVERVEEKRMAYFRAIEGATPVAYEEPVRSSGSASSFAERSSSSSVVSAMYSNTDTKGQIYDFLKAKGRPMCISEIMEECPACADLSNQRCSALIRQMVCDGTVERTERNRKAYFEAC